MRGFLFTTEGEGFTGPSGKPSLLSAENGDCKGCCGTEMAIFLLTDGGRQTCQFGFAEPGSDSQDSSGDGLRHLRCGTFARGGIEDLLSQPQGLRRGFDVFVGCDEFERAFEAHDNGWGE